MRRITYVTKPCVGSASYGHVSSQTAGQSECTHSEEVEAIVKAVTGVRLDVGVFA